MTTALFDLDFIHAYAHSKSGGASNSAWAACSSPRLINSVGRKADGRWLEPTGHPGKPGRGLGASQDQLERPTECPTGVCLLALARTHRPDCLRPGSFLLSENESWLASSE